ncbi:MAG: tetratricopeptide repeat protein [Gammaproteobacteria bacterium]|nr:tetratricopeptide repeat protein [Gammaproteobacteria bacterium]
MQTDNNTSRKVIIEQNKQFSKSALWRIQRDYFDREGINAWVNSVPFYITSNPFIAKTYARIMLSFIRDWIKKHPEAKNDPFYIMEIGTGSGRFSFYFVKTLHEMLANAGLEDIKVCHVMSDFTKSNMRYWEKHHALLPLIEKGWIDFALYDMEADRPINLVYSKIQLNAQTLKNPLVVVGNYIFDTALNDLFAVRENNLYELSVSVATDENNMKDNWPVEMEKVDVSYHATKIDSNFYGDPHIDAILEEYRTHLKETVFLFPVGAFHTLRFLKKLANDRLLLISTDKGNGARHTLDGAGRPPIYFHGSFFSAMVNFHAMGQYLKNAGGDFFLQTPRKGIKTSVFSSGFGLRELPETWQAIEDWVEGFSPADYFTLHRRMSDSFQECTLDTIASHLQLSQWDPHIYLKLSNRVISLAEEADADTVHYLSQNMKKIANNFYDMPKTECVLFEIGVFFHAIKRYDEARHYYELSKPFIGEKFGLHYNLALCLHHLKDDANALAHFKCALALDSNSKETSEWIAFLEKSTQEKPGTDRVE